MKKTAVYQAYWLRVKGMSYDDSDDLDDIYGVIYDESNEATHGWIGYDCQDIKLIGDFGSRLIDNTINIYCYKEVDGQMETHPFYVCVHDMEIIAATSKAAMQDYIESHGCGYTIELL